MARYKHYDYAQTMLVAVSLTDQLQAGTVEHTIHYVVQERLDLSGFDQERRNDETGRPGYDPRVLLKVVLPSANLPSVPISVHQWFPPAAATASP